MTALKTLDGDSGFEEFCRVVGLPDTEKLQRRNALQASFMPFKVTRYYAELIASSPEPSRSQLINIVLPPIFAKPFQGRFDPYGNRSFRAPELPFLQHKYEPTLLLHIDDFCVANCQFCYKVNEIRNERTSSLSFLTKVEEALRYLDRHQEINNILFTGGDPAAFRKTSDLTFLIERLISHTNVRVVRFATKGLAYDPDRFLDKVFLDFLETINQREQKQVSVIAQINHPSEITESCRKAIRSLQKAGCQIRGQPAIVRGVNDNLEVLTELQRKFLDVGIISYYFVAFMPVKGVEQYAIPLHEIFRVVAHSKRQLNGLEKKGVLIAPHDFGKFEICGFLPSCEEPEQIVLKWHEAAMKPHLPEELVARFPCQAEDILLLKYDRGMYCIDHVFAMNGLPYFNGEREAQSQT